MQCKKLNINFSKYYFKSEAVLKISSLKSWYNVTQNMEFYTKGLSSIPDVYMAFKATENRNDSGK